ncbi:peptidoglycan DD-metalloendopeptidase family protein [Streptomyces sp. NPDC045431]|uniref:M23 family metallopeptidase n=1 Tax=Streptomyces sp. NPDC045431 TaxID=3155613 RepID=UPI00340EA02F
MVLRPRTALGRPLLVLVVAVLVLLLPPPPQAAGHERHERHDGPVAAGAEVARLYEEAGRATDAYEQGRRAAAAQRATAARLQEELGEKRREVAVLHDRVGEVARLQYRTGGSLALTARLLLADDPNEVMTAQRLAGQAARSVNRLMEQAGAAERRLTIAEQNARAAWHALDLRTSRLAAIKREIEARLERAQQRLHAEAQRSVAAGRCRGAVRIDRRDGKAAAAGGRGARGRGPAWVAPVADYRLSARFDSAGGRWSHRHTGQDFAVELGEPVRSIGAGRVQSVSCGGSFGIEVVVRHENGWYSQYAHLAAPGVGKGERVWAGQWIGQAGTTGNSTGPHLHFEVRLTPHYGSAVDPVRWLLEHGVRLRE